MKEKKVREFAFPIIVTILGVIATLVDETSQIFIAIFLFIILALYFIFFVYDRLEKVEKKSEEQVVEVNKLKEKLKIHEHIIELRADVNELQRKGFKK